MKLLNVFTRFWQGFIVGHDWKIPVGVVLAPTVLDSALPRPVRGIPAAPAVGSPVGVGRY